MTDQQLPPGIERHYSTVSVAKLFDVTPETVRDWIKDGKMQAVQIERFWRIPESEVKKFAGAKYGVPEEEEQQ